MKKKKYLLQSPKPAPLLFFACGSSNCTTPLNNDFCCSYFIIIKITIHDNNGINNNNKYLNLQYLIQVQYQKYQYE